ncbi:NAD(P)-dependent dehydrogenase (short-subunit alcohol dehydrogenase family) [Arthrobacter sp. W4I7]|nr:NAD(P)-dependent dehydrogenase (short-subunit alcohol dehydrogenase family) [Arthrobacter sp. W4I7]
MLVNVIGAINLFEVLVADQVVSGTDRGAFVAVSSVDGVRGNPAVASYTMSKHALNGFVKAAALTHGPRGLRVNAVCAGPIATPMFASGERNGPEEVAKHDALIERFPLGYVCPPEAVARAVRFLVSDDGSYANGALVPVDGGLSLT